MLAKYATVGLSFAILCLLIYKMEMVGTANERTVLEIK
jgi:Na+-transporting methylmalonyl-CoA/oxaloacetate decarboxylase gamma subunit